MEDVWNIVCEMQIRAIQSIFRENSRRCRPSILSTWNGNLSADQCGFNERNYFYGFAFDSLELIYFDAAGNLWIFKYQGIPLLTMSWQSIPSVSIISRPCPFVFSLNSLRNFSSSRSMSEKYVSHKWELKSLNTNNSDFWWPPVTSERFLGGTAQKLKI